MKKILIIGASSDVGLELAARYASAGEDVTCVARRDCPDPRVRSYRADMAVETERNAALDYVRDNDCMPDLVVYAAGASMSAPAEYTAPEHYRYVWEVNYFAFVAVAQWALAHLAAVGGQIVVLSSMASVAPIPFDAHYSASKAALNAFVRVLEQEVAPYGVHVCSVLLGATATGFSFKRLVYDEAHCGKYYPESQKAAFTLGKMEQTGMAPTKAAAAADVWDGTWDDALTRLTIRNLYATDKNE